MKGRLRNVKINEQQRKFANFDQSNLSELIFYKDKYEKFILELCSGTGDFLVGYAEKEPESFFLGIDYAENAHIRALKKAFNLKLNNCKFINSYIQETLNYLPEEFFNTIYINFPDPWPKKRHINRRLVTKEFLCKINKFIKINGYCIIITDNNWYKEFIDEQIYQIKCYSKYFKDSWFTEDEEKFSSIFPLFYSNYYLKAKKLNNIVRFYILQKINLSLL
ncbi:MAG: tRNA (guanine(46)-N(7))-methyltransferase TrmB [Exilispira sp.]